MPEFKGTASIIGTKMAGVQKKSNYRIDIGTNRCIYLKARATSIGGIATEMGWVLDDDGIPPAGRIIVADNRADAMNAGLVPFRISYMKNKKKQSAVVLVSPERADTAREDLLGKTYNGGLISRVTAPRRVKYVSG